MSFLGGQAQMQVLLCTCMLSLCSHDFVMCAKCAFPGFVSKTFDVSQKNVTLKAAHMTI